MSTGVLRPVNRRSNGSDVDRLDRTGQLDRVWARAQPSALAAEADDLDEMSPGTTLLGLETATRPTEQDWAPRAGAPRPA